MRFALMPRSCLGQWSLATAGATVLLVAARGVVMRFADPDTARFFFSNPALEILNILAWLGGSAAFVTGVGALSYRDRSLSILPGILLGFAIFLNGVIRMMAPP